MVNHPPIVINKLVLRPLRKLTSHLIHNSLGYLTLLVTLYILTPFPFQLNTWKVARQRLLTVVELPIKAIDTAIAASTTKGGK
jgi:hypothetical protein